MKNLVINSYYTRFDANNNGYVMGMVGGDTIEIGCIGNCDNLTSTDVHNRAEALLKSEGVTIAPASKDSKNSARAKGRKAFLGLATNGGKINLKIANNSTTAYALYVKGTNKYVYDITPKGVHVVADGAKTKPMLFTDADIKLIGNLGDFDVKEVTTNGWVKNKIA